MTYIIYIKCITYIPYITDLPTYRHTDSTYITYIYISCIIIRSGSLISIMCNPWSMNNPLWWSMNNNIYYILNISIFFIYLICKPGSFHITFWNLPAWVWTGVFPPPAHRDVVGPGTGHEVHLIFIDISWYQWILTDIQSRLMCSTYIDTWHSGTSAACTLPQSW